MVDKITKSTEQILSKFSAIESEVQPVSVQETVIRNAMEEQSAGNKQVLEAITSLNEITQIVKNGSTEILAGSQEVIKVSMNLNRITEEVTNVMNEMANGAQQINIAVNKVNEMSQNNKECIIILENEIGKFKV